MKWHQTLDDVSGVFDTPEQYQQVVGLIGDRALACYINDEGDWIDNDHGCIMRNHPEYWIEMPE